MKARTNLILIAGLAIFTGLLVIALLNGVVRTRPVVVAAMPLSPGTRLTEDLVEVKQVPGGAVLDGAFESVEEVAGQTLTVGRAVGDQITADVVGVGAEVGIPAALAPDHVAVAVRVDQATGLAGVLRPGQLVSVVAIVDPQQLLSTDLFTPPVVTTSDYVANPYATPTAGATPEPAPDSAVARLTISGLKILLVPQAFRYEEVVAGEDELFSNARTTLAAQQGSVVILDAPLAPREVAPGLEASPAVLLAMLDNLATLHLVMEPAGGVVAVDAPATVFEDLYYALTGYEFPQTVDPAAASPAGEVTAPPVSEEVSAETTAPGAGATPTTEASP